MLDHHIQRAIVYKLALAQEMRFSELKPDTIENKLFDYHLKKVVAAKLVEKTQEGLYRLTQEGRRLGVHVLEDVQSLVDRAYSTLLLVIKNQDGEFLLYRRKNHPLKDKIGFMHALPRADESISETAAQVCKEKTGLAASFTRIGGGYSRVFNHGKLESFTHFDVLEATSISGELAQHDELADYFWVDERAFAKLEMLPLMEPLLAAYHAKDRPFYIEESLTAS